VREDASPWAFPATLAQGKRPGYAGIAELKKSLPNVSIKR